MNKEISKIHKRLGSLIAASALMKSVLDSDEDDLFKLDDLYSSYSWLNDYIKEYELFHDLDI